MPSWNSLRKLGEMLHFSFMHFNRSRPPPKFWIQRPLMHIHLLHIDWLANSHSISIFAQKHFSVMTCLQILFCSIIRVLEILSRLFWNCTIFTYSVSPPKSTFNLLPQILQVLASFVEFPHRRLNIALFYIRRVPWLVHLHLCIQDTFTSPQSEMKTYSGEIHTIHIPYIPC